MKTFACAAFLLALASAQPADALLCTPLLGCSCTVDATNLAFGAVAPLSGQAAIAVSDVSVSCTNVIDVAPVVNAKIGAGAWGAMSDRQMRSAANDRLHYNIYSSSLYATVLGDGAGGTAQLAISGGLLSLGAWSTTAHMYGRIPSAAATPTGAYTDTVTVRIDW